MDTRVSRWEKQVETYLGHRELLPLNQFLDAAAGLRKSGYRPVRFRPFADAQTVRVAAVWNRDGRNWTLAVDRAADEIRQLDERNRLDNSIPVDVAGYTAVHVQGKAIDRYAALWSDRAGPADDARLYIGVSPAEHVSVQDRLMARKQMVLGLNAMRGSDGRTRYSGVWGHSSLTDLFVKCSLNKDERAFGLEWAAERGSRLVDVTVSAVDPIWTCQELARAALEAAQHGSKSRSDELKKRSQAIPGNYSRRISPFLFPLLPCDLGLESP